MKKNPQNDDYLGVNRFRTSRDDSVEKDRYKIEMMAIENLVNQHISSNSRVEKKATVLTLPTVPLTRNNNGGANLRASLNSTQGP